MMDEHQFDTTNEQLAGQSGGQPDSALTTRDIVSAGRRASTTPDSERRGADATDNRAPRRDQRGEEYAADAGTAAPHGKLGDRLRERLRGDRAAAEDDSAGSGERDTVARDDRSATRADRRAEQERRADEPSPAPLLSTEATGAYQARWDAIQTAFVDEPRRVVEQADGLVAEVMQQLAETFARERASLERHWDQGGDVSTEDLRLALQRYRSFFQRLLST